MSRFNFPDSAYSPPRRQRILDDFDSTQGAGLLQLSIAGNSTPFEIPLSWNQNNIVRINSPKSTSARVLVHPGTGLLSGRFRDATGRMRKFRGICLQQSAPGEDLAVGFYLGDETSGRIEFLPQSSGIAAP
jgi:hypothetical protein